VAQRGSPAAPGPRAGTREARREEAALVVSEAGPRLVPPVATDLDEPAPEPERTGEEQGSAGSDETSSLRSEAESAEPERRPEGRAGREARAAAAQSELRRRREAREAVEPRSVPGVSDMAVEIGIGALRLARTVVTAPFRLALALLRAREV
jgi:hypothetical protein